MIGSSRSSTPTSTWRCWSKARAQSIVAYAMSHVGLFNYPDQGRPAAQGAQGAQPRPRDHRRAATGTASRCVLYTSLIFDRWSADLHPEWRMRTRRRQAARRGGPARAGLPQLALSRVRPRLGRGGVHALRLRRHPLRHDLLAGGCASAQHCQKRFADEVGGEIPTHDRTGSTRSGSPSSGGARRGWPSSPRSPRARCGSSSRRPASSTSRRPIPLNWTSASNTPLVPNNDFLQGDFYGDSLQGSFVRKLLEDLTPQRPFGFETSFSHGAGATTRR